VPALPRTQVSSRSAAGSSAPSQRSPKLLSNREEKAVVPVRCGDVLAGRYRLEEKIGEGGMGSVYVAHDQELDRRVAVKVLAANLVTDDEVVERFEREARLTAKLDHPNIAPVYDVGRHEGRPFIVMKLLEGDTLADLLRTKGALSSDETLKLMRQVAAGLDYIHGKGFIHRDIKAGNIFVSPTGHATILDFGILRPRSAGQGLTRTGKVMGTPHYMAPEQALGMRDVDHRVDIYALGVVLFECLTGTLPFDADSELRLIQMQAHAPPPDVLKRAPWIAKPVAEVMRRALAKRPDDRFNSGAELVKALEAAYRDAQGHAAAPSQKAGEGTAPGWRMRAGLLEALREKDAALREAEQSAAPLATPGAQAMGGVTGAGAAGEGASSGAAPASGIASGGASTGEASPCAESGPAGATPAFPATGASFDGVRSPSRRRVASLVAAATLFLVATVAWKSWPTKSDVTPSRDGGAALATARDAGATSPLVLAADAGADSGDAGAALAFNDAPDAGTGGPADAGAQAAVGKHPPGKRSGRLNVVTTHAGEPWWASVSINGVPRGRTPLLLDLPVGTYQLRVERAGFRTEEREIRVASGKSTVLRIDLVP
jgi:serine/threonine-protein kinase